MADRDNLRGAALALAGVAAHITAELTGSKKAARVAAWADSKFDEDEKPGRSS
jgi:hypothetical protein